MRAACIVRSFPLVRMLTPPIAFNIAHVIAHCASTCVCCLGDRVPIVCEPVITSVCVACVSSLIVQLDGSSVVRALLCLREVTSATWAFASLVHCVRACAARHSFNMAPSFLLPSLPAWLDPIRLALVCPLPSTTRSVHPLLSPLPGWGPLRLPCRPCRPVATRAFPLSSPPPEPGPLALCEFRS
eukprot:3479550-Pleurochrysis_carterae.AAC.1